MRRLSSLLAILVAVGLAAGCGGANQTPAARFNHDPAGGEAPLTVAFDAAPSSDGDGRIVEFRWEFGDGQTAEGQKVSHAFTQAGAYQVKLEVTDDKGATATRTATVTVNPAAAIAPDFELAKSTMTAQGCGACHTLGAAGLTMAGQVGPDLTAQGLRNRSDEWLRTQLTNPAAIPDAEVTEGFAGKQNLMPAYDRLSEAELISIIAFLQSLKTPVPAASTGAPADDPVAVAKGVIQSQGCGSCHTLHSDDFDLTGQIGPDLSRQADRGRDRNWLLRQLRNPLSIPDAEVAEGYAGAQTVMPSYDRTLSDAELDALVDYLLSLEG